MLTLEQNEKVDLPSLGRCASGPIGKFQAIDHVLFVPPVSETVTFRDPSYICAYP